MSGAVPIKLKLETFTTTSFRSSITQLLQPLCTLHTSDHPDACKTRFWLFTRLYQMGFAPTGLHMRFQGTYVPIPINQTQPGATACLESFFQYRNLFISDICNDFRDFKRDSGQAGKTGCIYSDNIAPNTFSPVTKSAPSQIFIY